MLISLCMSLYKYLKLLSGSCTILYDSLLVFPSVTGTLLGRVRLGSSGLGGLLRFLMTRSIGLSLIRMSHPSSSGSSEKFTDEFG